MDLAHHSQELSAGNPQRLVQHANDLIVTLLSQGIEPTDTTRGCIQRSAMLRVKDHIDQQLHDPALTPSEIAATASISTRYLHKLFESEGQTVSEYVRDRRLDRVHKALLDPGRTNLTITTIATHAGFGDISGFNRSFRSRYGVTPRELRQGMAPTQARKPSARPVPTWSSGLSPRWHVEFDPSSKSHQKRPAIVPRRSDTAGARSSS
jgi:AraC-like DNA-binding protein